jgi:hypothetical protein
MLRLSPALSLALALSAWCAPALAQEAAADALFDSARAAMTKGDYANACEQFRASDKLDPAVGTELNLAECEEKRGRLASAWELYRTVADKLSESDERLGLARSRIQALAPRVPRVALSLAANAPKNCTIRAGSLEIGAAALGVGLPLDPGAHEFVVSAPGFESRAFQIQLAEGEARALEVEPGNAVSNLKPATRPASSSTTNPPATTTGNHSSKRTLGFALGGVGIVSLGVGAVSGALMLNKKHTVADECHADKSCSSAGLSAAQSGRTLEMISNVAWIAGAATLAAGAYFVLTGSSSAEPSTALGLTPNPTGGQVSLSRSF